VGDMKILKFRFLATPVGGNTPHWFEAEYEEIYSANSHFVYRFLIYGSLIDLGPAKPEEIEEYRKKYFYRQI
jgi:hypothetical protein